MALSARKGGGRPFGWHSGSMTCKDAYILGDLTIQDDIIFGDASAGKLTVTGNLDMSSRAITETDSALILGGNCRISTMSNAGSAADIDATYFQYSEGLELRYTVSDWADTYTLTSFKGMYLRAQNEEANASASIYGMEVYGVANNVNTQYVWGALIYAYSKGSGARTIDSIYAVQPELSFDAGSTTHTLTTEAICVRAKITGGKVDDYTKIHGVQVKAGDMNGASVTYGNAFWVLDDAGMAGTITWTIGLNLAANCTTGVSISGTTPTGVSLTGTHATGGLVMTGTFASGHAIAIGTFGTPLTYNTDEFVEIHCRHSDGVTTKPGMRVRNSAPAGIAMTTGVVTGIQAQAYGTDTSDVAGLNALEAHVGIKANCEIIADITITPNLTAGYFKIEDLGFDLTLTGDAAVLCLGFQFSTGTTLTGNADWMALNKEGSLTDPADAFIRVYDGAGGGWANFLIDAPASLPYDAANSSNTQSGKIAIKIGGNTKYIQCYSD